jgi:mycothiol synthase
VDELRVTEALSPAERAEVEHLHDRVLAFDGHPSLGDGAWREVSAPTPSGEGARRAASFLVHRDGALIGYGNLAPADNAAPPHVSAGAVVAPDARDDDVEAQLLEAMVRDVGAHGGALVIWWRLGAGPGSDRVAEQVGFGASRDLHEMHVPLPLAEAPRWPTGVEVRTFVPGRDEDGWLAVNNRAFAGHPEQGGWVRATLERRMREPWFDPKGFLLAFDAGGLAGFCWTKVHDAASEADRLGEIYVIGVDPSRKGRKLGRPLVIAGLHSLADRGLRTGMLFVDGANDAAFRLYTSLGFASVRVDRAYELTVPAS